MITLTRNPQTPNLEYFTGDLQCDGTRSWEDFRSASGRPVLGVSVQINQVFVAGVPLAPGVPEVAITTVHPHAANDRQFTVYMYDAVGAAAAPVATTQNLTITAFMG